MRVSSGARIGPYEILAPLGAGGMGEVYRARDSRLKRDVAIKILPPEFATDEERLARFTREAHVLAALNHPNIASIYGIEETADARALVMELVDGHTLADRLDHGPLPVDEAVAIARQISDALEAAHEKGIIHRDLKPANIAISSEGDVKVLDFGLAKALEPESGADASLSPTLTLRATQAGVILGTAAYMSPEQARGRAADKRTDVWAFGCVLYEMLTARRAFEGEDVTDTIAAVVRAEPDWATLPAGVPPQIELLLRRCLVKDRKQRISDIGVARFLLSEAGVMAPSAAARAAGPRQLRMRTMLSLATAVGVGVAFAALAFWGAARLRSATPPQPMRFAVSLLSQPISFAGVDRDIAISADGRYIAYRTLRGGQPYLAVRAIEQLEPRVLTSTLNPRQPFFSPDGRWIGFFSGSELKKVAVDGGAAIAVCRISGVPRQGTWGDDDVITFATNDQELGLQRVAAAGGAPTAVTSRNQTDGEQDHINPSALPGGRGVLFTIVTTGFQLDTMRVAVLDGRTQQVRTVVQGGADARYLPTGHVVYAAGNGLRAVKFDLERLEATTGPVPVEERVATSNIGIANYAVSDSGTLIFVQGAGTGSSSAARSMVWVDRRGREEPINAPARSYNLARLSPDGTRIAVEVRDQDNDIWVWSFTAQTLTRLTFDAGLDRYPIWTPDGKKIVFSSTRNGVANVFARAADGTGTDERLTESRSQQDPHSITPDGSQALLMQLQSVFALKLRDRQPNEAPTPVLQSTAIQWLAEVSPNGRYIAYASNEASTFEVIVRPFPAVESGRWQVSTTGGTKPVWSRDGRELLYLDSTNNLISVPVNTEAATFGFGNGTKILDPKYYYGAPPNRTYDVSLDGKRFLMIKDHVSTDPSDAPFVGLTVVVNWFEELRNRVPAVP